MDKHAKGATEWKMVPVITTLEMDRAAISSGESDDVTLDIHQVDRIWSAMLLASPAADAERAMISLKDHKTGQAALLEHIESLKACNLQAVEALETIASLYDHEKTGPEMAHNMYSARCIALQALRVIKGERG